MTIEYDLTLNTAYYVQYQNWNNKAFHILGVFIGETDDNLIFRDTKAGVKALISKESFISAVPALRGGSE